jgi:hypothetical protein
MAISMRVTMVVISWLSISLSYSSWLGFSLAIAIAMTITTISMMVISWLSYGSSEEGKGNSNLKQFKVIEMFPFVESNKYW